MTTTEPETKERSRRMYLERMVEQTDLDREALAVINDEHGKRWRFEVLGGRNWNAEPHGRFPCFR